MEKKYWIILGVILFLLISGGITIPIFTKQKEPNTIYTLSEEDYKELQAINEADKNPFYIDETARDCTNDNRCYRFEICYMLCKYGENSTPVRCRVKSGYTGKCMQVPCYEYCTDDSKAHMPCCPVREINVFYDEENNK